MTDREIINHGKVCPDCGSAEWHTRGSIKCEQRELANLRREAAAWRALASLQDGRYTVAFPGRRTMGDFGGSVADRTKRKPDGIGGTNVVRVYGEGPTPQAAAIMMAERFGLIPAAGEAKEAT